VHLASRVRIAVAAFVAFAGGLHASTALADGDHVFVCPPVTQEIVVNGELDEWDKSKAIEIKDEKTQFVRRDPSYGGPADLSGRIYVARSATTLYIAGEILDDTLYWNSKTPYLGDGVEIFFDFHPRPETRTSPDPKLEPGYDEFAHQLILHPLADEVRWRFQILHGRTARLDDEVDGVRLAGLPLRDAKGATIGYKFELALPFSNFPAAPTAEGASFGFDVALSDSDGKAEQKNYATWTGHSDLSRFPGRFGRLVLGPAPPPIPVPDESLVLTIGPIAVLVALLGAILFLWLTQIVGPRGAWLSRRLERLHGVSRRWKIGASAVLIVLIAAAGYLADGAAGALNAADLLQKRKIASLVRRISDEANGLHLSDPQLPLHPSPLTSLLAGKSVKPPVEYEYTVVSPVTEETNRTRSGVPFFRRDIPATSAWSGSFVVHPPVAAGSATAIYSWRPSPGVEKGPQAGDRVAEIRLVHEDGTVDSPQPLVVRAAPGAEAEVPAGGADVAFVSTASTDGTKPAFRAWQTTWTPKPSESRINRIELEQTVAGGTVVLHGLTLTPAAGGAPVPQPLGRATRSGVPTCASPFPDAAQGLQLSSDTPGRVSVACDAQADKIWLVVSLRRGFLDSRYRAPVLYVDAVFDDGTTEGPFRLENGVSIDAETTPSRQHGEAYTSELAFEWGEPGQPRRHYDCMPLELDRPGRRLVEMQFESKCQDEIVRISSITAGKLAAARRPAELTVLQSGPDGYRVRPEDLARFEGVAFTMFRDDTAIATTAAGDLRDRMLSRTLTPEQAAAAAHEAAGFHEVRVLEDKKLHALAIALPGSRILEMTWFSDVDRTVADQVSVARGVLAALLAPLLVLLVADLVLSIRSLHVRLVAAIAAVAAAPVALGWFAVPMLLGSSIEGRETEAARLKSATVKGRLAALRSQARQRAEAALRDEALQEALRRRGAPEYAAAVTAALRDIEHGLGTGARVSLEVFPLSSSGEPIVFPPQSQWTVFADRTATLTDELAYRLSRLTATGVAQQYDTAGDWRTTLVVELPLERSTLLEAAGAAGSGVQALLYTPRGWPMATTIDARFDELETELAHKRQVIQRVLAQQQPVVETRTLAGTPHTVAYDVLRGESGVVGLVATAVPRGGTDEVLRRIGLVAVLVFGAGVAMQFLLAGLVADSTSKPFLRALRGARDASGAPVSQDKDEIAAIDESIAVVRDDREVYRAELSRLADAVQSLGAADGPDAVVARALAVVRDAVAPWGALLVAADADGRIAVLGGFRGDDAVPAGPVVVTDAHPLAAVVFGRGESHLASTIGVPEISVRGDRPLLGGATRIDAWPVGAADRPGGALVLLADAMRRPRPVHDRFVAALARNVGIALSSARLVRLAVHDADTSAYVPGFFAERLEEEVDRAVTGRRHVALMLVRATALPSDGAAARRAMQQLAEAVRASSPARAFLGRVETDVLAAASPETDRPAVDEMAVELRRLIAERGLADLRVKIGVAACPEDAGSFEFLNAEARRALASEDVARPAPAGVAADDRARLVAAASEIGAVFESDTSLKMLETIERIAASDIAILVTGETGSGKEVIADLVHGKSARRGKPMVKVNCAALPDALLESELFGYERGAFTGADHTKPGRFELADGGTIFLDEIGDMPLATQVKLLRVLEARAVEHLGGTAPTPIDVRVIAATNRDLRAAMAAGRFREDLYYRLSAVTISVPPLRARKEEIPRLAERFVREAAEAQGRRPPTFAADAMDLLFRHPWPGNVRELKNVVDRAVVLSGADVIRAADLGPALAASASSRPRGHLETSRREPARVPEPPRPSPPGAMSDRQRRLLALLSEREWVTNGEYCSLVGVSQRTGLRDLQELLERGVVVMEGKRRGARYRLR
jgi:DNA-binding NtrC family response regulator